MKKQYIAPVTERVFPKPIMDGLNPGSFDSKTGGGGMLLKGSGNSGKGVGTLQDDHVIV